MSSGIFHNKMMKLNKKGISFIIMYSGLFVFAMILLFVTVNKFKITTERATLFQAADSAAREVAFKQYTISSDSLEKSSIFTANTAKNIQIATSHLQSLGVANFLTVNDVSFNTAQAKVVVTCTYKYSTNYLYLTKTGLVKKPFNHTLKIKGIAYLKSVEFKE